MGKIIILDDLTASQIAAGEVIERPASVVKELAENAIDAGASVISAEIKAGGIKYIRVTDNGCGFEPDDAVIAFDKHATSKIICGSDLDEIRTLGFRGEALASIAAVSDVELLSRTEQAKDGIYVRIKGGSLLESGSRGAAKGTVLTVRDLFYNTPARFKFLKKDQTEAGYVADILQKLALAHPEVSFRLISSGNDVLHTPGNHDLLSCVYSIYGKSVSASLLPVEYESDRLRVDGFVGIRDAIYGSRSRQTFFVNGRHIKSKLISSALDEAYKTVTMKGKFPFALLRLTVPCTAVDVNVHPAKTEVRFSDESAVFRCIYHGVSNALFMENTKTPAQAASGSAVPPPIPASRPSPAQKPQAAQKAESFYHPLPDPQPQERVQAAVTQSSKPPAAANRPPQEAIDSFLSVIAENTAEFVPDLPPLPAEAPPVAAEASIPAAVSADIPAADHSDDRQETAEETAAPLNLLTTYNSTSVYTDSTVIGQVFDTYLILQDGDDMVLIDQHAAHERIMYERFKHMIESKASDTQLLLLPLTVQLTPSEHMLLIKNMDFFTNIGFALEDFGGHTVLIRGIPCVMEHCNITEILLDGLEHLQKSSGEMGQYPDEAIYSMACKAAVKANKRLSELEISELLRQLAGLENSGTCPHGRPITVRISKKEMERRFKR